MSQLPDHSKELPPTSEPTGLEKSLTSTPESKTTDSPTPTTETPGNDLSLSRGGSDGQLIRTKRMKTSLDRLEENVGGRDQVIDALALHTLDKKQEHFLRLLCDPARRGDSLATICRDAGLNPIAMLDLLRHASTAKGTALALTRMATKLPEVVDDIIDKSIDAKVQCPNCFGEGFIAEDVRCTQCMGKGEIFRPSDIDRQKMVTEMTGLQKKGPGVAVQVNQNVNNNVTVPNLFSKYVKASDEAAYDVIDVIPEDKS